METLLLSPLKLGVLLRLTSGLILMNSLPPPPDQGAPQEYVEQLRPSPELQSFLEETIQDLESHDKRLKSCEYTVALIDLSDRNSPARLAQVRGDSPIYPASVVKFVYLMAAFRWQEEGRLRLDREMRRQLTRMIHDSSNQATQWVFWKLTGTDPGPTLQLADYTSFRDRRLSIKRWVQSLGVEGIHCVHPTYDSKYEIFGREAQFFNDTSIAGGGQGEGGQFYNRLMLTAVGTAKLLALLATDRAMQPRSCGAVREMMRRDVREQPYLAPRIAGGASRLPGLEVFSKSGTYGRFYADAGIVRHVSGRQMVLAVYTESKKGKGYRGRFIADLTERCAAKLLLDEAPPDSASAALAN